METRLPIPRVRRPVRRSHADRYMLLTLLGFAGSVVVTRVFLELTGYPQVGNRTLHVAHVLWGGLLLFVAMLLPLLLANRSMYVWSAIVGGIGVGLFIDEVGKFITQTNDYFYPAAAPIIYAFFLVTVMLYLQIARRKIGDPRYEMYAALDDLQDVIDHPIYEREREQLEQRLEHVMQNSGRPDLALLAKELLDYLHSDEFVLRQHEPTLEERLVLWADTFEQRWVSRGLYRLGLGAGLLITAVPALLDSIDTLQVILTDGPAQQEFVRSLIRNDVTSTPHELTWLAILVVLEGIVAIPSIVGAALLFLRRERYGIEVAVLGLLISLTMVNLLVFYFDQFFALTNTLIQFALLMLVLHYRHRYLPIGLARGTIGARHSPTNRSA